MALHVGLRRKHRVAFRRMAMDMASRYLLQMEIFRARSLQRLENLLGNQVPALPKSKVDDLTRFAWRTGVGHHPPDLFSELLLLLGEVKVHKRCT